MEQAISQLVINSTPVSFESATLRRNRDRLETGLAGSDRWELELVKASLPDETSEARVELTADGVDYSGAARVAEGPDDPSRTILVGSGPLISYVRVE